MIHGFMARCLYWIAQAALPLGRYGALLARVLLIRALALDPKLNRAQGWLCLVEATFARDRQDLETAIRLLREASRLLPDNDAVSANLGIALSVAGRHDEAVEVIERAMRGEMDLTGELRIWVALAWSYLVSGRAPKALEACRRASESRVRSPEILILQVLAQASCHGLLHKAELSRLLRARPSMLPLVLQYVQRLVRRQAPTLARDVMGCLPATLQARCLTVIARSALNEDDLASAQWAVKELERQHPDSTALAGLRIGVALRQGRSDVALREAKQALARDVRSPAAWETLAKAQLCSGDHAGAILSAREALDRGATGALARGILALAFLERDAVREAKRLFVVHTAGDALGCLWAHAAQALVHALHGQPKPAAMTCRRAVEDLARLPAWAAGRACLDRPAAALRRAIQIIGPKLGEEAAALEHTLDAALDEAARRGARAYKSLPP